MKKLLTIACCLSAMTASAQYGSDLRNLAIRLNPATVIAPEANNVLDLNYQYLSSKDESSSSSLKTVHFGSLNYAHNFHFGSHTLTAGAFYLGQKGENIAVGHNEFAINLAYTKAFGNKHFLSLGSNVRMKQYEYGSEASIKQYSSQFIDDCAFTLEPQYPSWTDFQPQIDAGAYYRVQYNKNANLRVGLAFTDISRNTTYIKSPYIWSAGASIASDFMVSKRIGFSPSILVANHPLNKFFGESSLQLGSDVRYLLNDKNELRLGYHFAGYDTHLIGLRYIGSKGSVGVMCNVAQSKVNNDATNLQTNIQYRF
jgi:hypothetical protein